MSLITFIGSCNILSPAKTDKDKKHGILRTFHRCSCLSTDSVTFTPPSGGTYFSILTSCFKHPPMYDFDELRPWPPAKWDYIIRNLIAVGTTARVYAAFCVVRREMCVIKIIDLKYIKCSKEELTKQFQLVSQYKHTNIMSYYTTFYEHDCMWVVMNFLKGGSLQNIINYKLKVFSCRSGVLDEATIATILKYVLKALEYMNARGEPHRDIRAANILIGNNGTVQITNFGLSCWIAAQHDVIQLCTSGDFVGSAHWMAPEVVDLDAITDNKIDIWSLGITAIEMATGRPPFHQLSPMEAIKRTLHGDPPDLDTGAVRNNQYKMYGKSFRKFISACLNKNSAKRPTPTELLNHTFIKKAKDEFFIASTLLPLGPSYEARVRQASKRDLGAACRLHRTVSKEWVWSEPEQLNVPHKVEEKPLVVPRTSVNSQQLISFKSKSSVTKIPKTTSKPELSGEELLTQRIAQSVAELTAVAEDYQLFDKPLIDNVMKTTKTEPTMPSGKGSMQGFRHALSLPAGQKTVAKQSDMLQTMSGILPAQKETPQKPIDVVSSSRGHEPRLINIVYRMRIFEPETASTDLNDIHITYNPDKDTPEGLAGEMVKAGLLDPRDTVPVANSLTRLLQQQGGSPLLKTITFHLITEEEEYDEEVKEVKEAKN